MVLDRAVPPELREELVERLAYAGEHVRRCSVSPDGHSIEVIVDSPGHEESTVSAVRQIVNALLDGYREIDKVTLWRHQVAPACREPIWEEMLNQGLLIQEGPGCIALLGDAARVALALDAVYERLAQDVFSAVPEQYPTLIPIASMERCDYLSSFPHHVTLAAHFRENVESIAEIAAGSPETRKNAIQEALAPATHMLSPAVCFHTYARLAGHRPRAPLTITAVGRCFRWESTNFNTVERLWDFTMREIVFVGPSVWVEERRQLALETIKRLVEELWLDASIDLASDPFFINRFAAKRFHQLLTHGKYELKLSLPYSGGVLSAGSFNIHEDFFGRAFGIHGQTEGFASTGCVAFGIERWVWALFAQHGPNLIAWPKVARVRLGL